MQKKMSYNVIFKTTLLNTYWMQKYSPNTPNMILKTQTTSSSLQYEIQLSISCSYLLITINYWIIYQFKS